MFEIKLGDCLEVLRTLPDESVQCCVTSPPYWGLRDYGVEGQLGLERTPEEYVAKMVEVFREVRRVLRNDGTLWLNLGDSYAHSLRQSGAAFAGEKQNTNGGSLRQGFKPCPDGLKEKDLCGIPWMVAFALRSDGWYLRQDIIWAKPNPMPESVRDRCTKSHEYIFLLSKSERYFYDNEAIAEPSIWYGKDERSDKGNIRYEGKRTIDTSGKNGQDGFCTLTETRNRRSVWTITTQGYSEAHFATFPPEIPEICIKAGTKEGDTVLDPFSGAGTTGLVATRLNRNYIGIELNPAYVKMATDRIVNDAPLFNAEPEPEATLFTQAEL